MQSVEKLQQLKDLTMEDEKTGNDHLNNKRNSDDQGKGTKNFQNTFQQILSRFKHQQELSQSTHATGLQTA